MSAARMTALAVAIDSRDCRDDKMVGFKAARLAQARAAGLPVPESVAVPCEVSAAVLAAATRDAGRRGVHACRLDVMAADRTALGTLVGPARRMGQALAVRSSAPLEGDPQLAGAYSSLLGVSPDEVPTAVLAVWASAIRDTGPAAPMGVLIQPDLAPDWAGTAQALPGGPVTVVAVRGSAQALTAGWAAGVTATVSPAGAISGAALAAGTPPAGPMPDGPVLRAVAAVARQAAEALGDDLIEWAFSGGRAWLIQSGRSGLVTPRAAGDDACPPPASPVRPEDRQLVLRAVRCAGDLAERWILPWAVGFPARPDPDQELRPRLLRRPGAAWEQATGISARLTSQVWGVPPGQAARVAAELASLRHTASLPDQRPSALRPPDPRLACRCLRLWAALAAHLVAAGVIAAPRQIWALPADLEPVLRGTAAPPDPHRSARQAALRWEPLLYSAVMAGTRLRGVPVSPGMGCGPGLLADDAAVRAAQQPGGLPERCVIVARYPLPRYSPMLMSAAGLIAHGGSEAAHLVTVARSLGVPAVLGCDLPAVLQPGARVYVAVDGSAGTAAILTDYHI